MSFSFTDHPDSVSSSPFISGVISLLCSRFVNYRNRSNHCLGVNTAFPSEVFASRFGTMFSSAKKFPFNLKRSILRLGYRKSINVRLLFQQLYRIKQIALPFSILSKTIYRIAISMSFIRVEILHYQQ